MLKVLTLDFWISNEIPSKDILFSESPQHAFLLNSAQMLKRAMKCPGSVLDFRQILPVFLSTPGSRPGSRAAFSCHGSSGPLVAISQLNGVLAICPAECPPSQWPAVSLMKEAHRVKGPSLLILRGPWDPCITGEVNLHPWPRLGLAQGLFFPFLILFCESKSLSLAYLQWKWVRVSSTCWRGNIYLESWLGSLYQCLFSVWPRHVARAISVLWPGTEPVLPAVEARSLNHWSTREAWFFISAWTPVHLLYFPGYNPIPPDSFPCSTCPQYHLIFVRPVRPLGTGSCSVPDTCPSFGFPTTSFLSGSTSCLALESAVPSRSPCLSV